VFVCRSPFLNLLFELLTLLFKLAESVLVHGTLSDSASAVCQASFQHVLNMACSPVEPTFHKQLKVTAETLLPEDSSSSSRFVY
jgi:hypothetical protein